MSSEILNNESPAERSGMRTFLIVWIGQIISIIGSGMTSFALGVWIYQETRQATPFAITVLLGSLPRLLLTPVAGSLADRWNRKRLMILADTGNAVITLVTALLVFSGGLQVWNIYLLAMFGSAFSAFQEPAYTASITMLVPKKELARASGMMQMGQAIEMLIAPLLAGALFGVIGLGGIIVIDFVTYFFAVGALFWVHIPQPEIKEMDGKSGKTRFGTVLADMGFGLDYLRQRAGLLGLLLYFALVNFLLNFSAVLMAPLVLSTAGAAAFGLVQTFSGLGMLGGSVAMSAWGGPKQRIRAVIGFICLMGFGLALAGLQAGWLFPALGFLVMMVCVPIASASSQAIFQTKIEPSVQGRIFAVRSMISRSMMPLAFLLSGPLADRVFEPLMQPGGALDGTFVSALLGSGAGRGVGLLFVLAGLLLLLVSLLAFANPRIRYVETELPDQVPGTV